MQYFIILMFSCSSLSGQTSQRPERCLPKGINLTDVVSSQFIKSAVTGTPVEQVTVRAKLIELKARCKKGKLVDSSGKRIIFYRLTGCWGNPPVDYREILERQRSEIEKLKRRYTMVEMTCNPSGVFPQ
jgi:hypothetical protein